MVRVNILFNNGRAVQLEYPNLEYAELDDLAEKVTRGEWMADYDDENNLRTLINGKDISYMTVDCDDKEINE